MIKKTKRHNNKKYNRKKNSLYGSNIEKNESKSNKYRFIDIPIPESNCKNPHDICINPDIIIQPIFKDAIIDKFNEDLEHHSVDRFKERNKTIKKMKLDPRRDFYTFINYEWIKKEELSFNKTPTYYIKYDSFRILQNKINYEMIDIVKDYIKNNNTPHAKKVRNIYESALKSDHYVMKENIKELKKTIEYYLKENDLIKFLAHINKNEMVSWGCPISWNMTHDEKDAVNIRHHIYAPELSYFDYDLYESEHIDTIKYSKEFKAKFNKEFLDFLGNLFLVCLGPDHGLNPQHVLDVELDILESMSCYSTTYSLDFYNRIKPKDYNKFGIDLHKFAKDLGCSKSPEFFIIGSPSYVKCIMDKLNKEWNTPKWIAYWYYMYLRQMAVFSKELHPLRHTFFKKIVAGREGIIPQDVFPLFSLSYCFNTFLSKKFIAKTYYQSRVTFVQKLGENMRKTFINIIERNKWLNPKTKAAALMKLNNLVIDTVHPRFMVEDPEIDYPENNIWEAMTKVANWRTDFLLKLDGKHYVELPGIDFGVNNGISLSGTQPYIVNAFYDSVKNNIYVPMGIIQPPFVKISLGLEYNIANIGYTFGHELSHCLDNTGRLYDYKGNMNNWWTPADAKIFENKVKDVVKQYELFASYDGIKMDASHMSGENLADISGMAICIEYLHTCLHTVESNTAINYLAFRKLFTYIAFQWKEIVYKTALEWNIKSNPHPLVKYRTNCPLSRIDIFKAMFNVIPGDRMYWKSDTIWSN